MPPSPRYWPDSEEGGSAPIDDLEEAFSAIGLRAFRAGPNSEKGDGLPPGATGSDPRLSPINDLEEAFSAEGNTIPINDLEEDFSATGRNMFQPGNLIEADFIRKLEVVFETETSQYEAKQLEEVYFFLVILAKRIQLRLKEM